MERTPRLQQATKRVRGSFNQSLFAIFSPRRAKPGRRSPKMPLGVKRTRKGRRRFAWAGGLEFLNLHVAQRLFVSAEQKGMSVPRVNLSEENTRLEWVHTTSKFVGGSGMTEFSSDYPI